jgi:hypothetical protein
MRIKHCLVIAIILTAKNATAQTNPIDEASERVNHGLELYAAGDLEGARREWAGAQSLVPSKPNPYRLLAMVDARLGRCQEAVREADLFLKLAPADDRRRGDVESIREQCQRELAPKTGSLKVTTSPPGAEVRIDEEQGALAGHTPLALPLAVGRHVVFLRKQGFVAVTRAAEVTPGSALQIDVALAMLDLRRGLTSDEALRRAAETMARQHAQEEARQRNEEMRAYAINERRWERDHYLHTRKTNIVVGSIFTGIGIGLGAAGLSFMVKRNNDLHRLERGGLPINNMIALGSDADSSNYLAYGTGIPGALFCAVGLPILMSGLAKLKVPAALKETP